VIEGLLETHGLNEFEVEADEHVLLKFAKQIYENPLILLLLSSAGVSLLVGNTEDAISIAIAVVIVLTGEFLCSGRLLPVGLRGRGI
jgi:Ca2+-transporting ATPase